MVKTESVPAGVLKMFDRDNDGKITRDEVPDRLLPTFNRLDRDQSGDLTLEELKQGLE